jgi:glyoxylase-like metal-dependent hydrolase (beta-lactamase superfamily II)
VNRAAIEVDLDVILTAEVPTPYGYVFRAPGGLAARLRSGLNLRGEMIVAPCLAFVVRHPTAGVILVDTGLHPDALRSVRRDFGAAMGLIFRGLRAAGEPFDAQLRARGVEPADVESVLMTHLHVDHTSAMRLLPNARFTVARTEWEATRTRVPAARGYVPRHFPAPDRLSLVDVHERGEPWGPFGRTLDLLGDGSVRLIASPGHTPGHLSMLVNVTGGRSVLLVGDAAYTRRSIDEQILPLLCANDAASRATLRELKAFAAQDPTALLVPSHDPDAYHGLVGAAAAATP